MVLSGLIARMGLATKPLNIPTILHVHDVAFYEHGGKFEGLRRLPCIANSRFYGRKISERLRHQCNPRCRRSAYCMRRGTNAAIRLAYIHNIGDVWVSLAPVSAGLLLTLTGYSFFDPLWRRLSLFGPLEPRPARYGNRRTN